MAVDNVSPISGSTFTSDHRIIALCGPEGVGKTYLASRSGRRVVSFADPLRDIVSVMTGIPTTDLRDGDVKRIPLRNLAVFSSNDERTIRDLLIATGGFMRSFNDDYFITTTMDILDGDGFYIIDDLRFDREAAVLRECFGDDVIIIRVASDEGDVYAEGMTYKDRYTTNGIDYDEAWINRHDAHSGM